MKRRAAPLALILTLAACSSSESSSAARSADGASPVASAAPTLAVSAASPIPTFCADGSPAVENPGVAHSLQRPERVGTFKRAPEDAARRSARASIEKSLEPGAQLVSVDRYVNSGSTAVVIVTEGFLRSYNIGRVNFICSAGSLPGNSALLKTARAVPVEGFSDPIVCFDPATLEQMTVGTCAWFDDYGVRINVLGEDADQVESFTKAYRLAAEAG